MLKEAHMNNPHYFEELKADIRHEMSTIPVQQL
jgi:hypothetical protein